MNKETAIPLAKNILMRFLRIKKPYKSGGSTTRSRYCYSVWMRHLNHWNQHRIGVPEIVAELGPGKSLGIGFCALLSGSRQLHTLDVIEYWDAQRNLDNFNELVNLFKSRANIPNQDEFPKVIPALDHYGFPRKLLNDDVLELSLNEERLNAIRSEILDLKNPNNKYIKCHVPWYDSKIINNASVDFIYSQSVLQYIDDLDGTFVAMKNWLKPNGLMSHSIDLSSIGITKNWNSHWTFSDLEWKLMKVGRDFIITRRPFSAYINQHKTYDFKILEQKFVMRESKLQNGQLASTFKHLSDSDIKTSDAYILSENG
ncbi:methyltransferase domain-containing protein [Winogradskyella sp.]|uniref:methyltransferase domain-containing protein n=1 Tax=Winogradskyella sp. TaxID=1883156 RepID=UPI00261AA176|nr:methyltransferase domain-containing protein [Winogradskyella sp.]